jgi:hypothetical protein
LLSDSRSRKAVEVAERFAENDATVEELLRAEEDANDVWNEMAYAEDGVTDAETDAADAATGAACYAEAAIGSAKSASHEAAHALSYEGHQASEQKHQGDLLRDLFGVPFHPVATNPSWLMWKDGTVVKLIEAIYQERAFNRLPILADALEEAGCTDAAILDHCRQPGEHVRGCWVVDLLLGKQ